jgi:hypothetical protein
MQSKVKSNTIVTYVVDEASPNLVTFKVKGAGEFTLNMAATHDENRARAMRHGFIQRIVDAGAIGRDPNTGLSAPPEVRAAAMRAVSDHYNSGAEGWSPKRAEGAGSKGGLDGLLLAAVGEAIGKERVDVITLVNSGAATKGMKPGAYLAALATSARVSPIVTRMRAEASGVDADDLLGELEGE